MFTFNRQKKLFKDKADSVQKMIWDLEFKKFKLTELREEIRKEHDRTKEALDALAKELEKDHKPETKEVLEKRLKETTELLEHRRSQIDGLDNELYGRDPNQQPSVQAQLDGCHELRKYIDAYVRTL